MLKKLILWYGTTQSGPGYPRLDLICQSGVKKTEIIPVGRIHLCPYKITAAACSRDAVQILDYLD